MTAVAGTVTVADLPGADELLSQAGSENFSVANALLGAEPRRHLMALYGYARLVDDVGDEADGDRLALLDVVSSELDAIYARRSEPARPGEVQAAGPSHPVMIELARTVAACGLPDGPLRRLIEANRVDQTVTRYATYGQLLQYCTLSANPVGELVLGVFGAATPERIALSDQICTALQIAEHLQDIVEDHARDRIYLPAEDLVRFGCEDEDLSATPSAPLRALIAFEARRARALLTAGAPLARTLTGRQRIAIAAFVAGGRAALDGLPGGGREGGEGRPRGRALAMLPAFARSVTGR